MVRSKTVDILRALAIFLVLGRHTVACPLEVSPFLHRISVLWSRGGWIGVDLFFVLSGFLVSGLLFREHEKFGCISGKHFLVRRGFKIYPPFWLLIFATIVEEALFHHHAFQPKAIAFELLFLQNYGTAVWNHTWSLAIEEHFYFFLVLFLSLLSARCRTPRAFRLVPAAFVVLAILCLSLRIFTAHLAPYNQQTHLFPSHLRMDSLFAGVFISYLYHFHTNRFLDWARRYRVPLLIVGVLLLGPAFAFPLATTSFISTFGLTLFYVGSGCLLIAALVTHLPDNRVAAALAYTGSHSYSIYLWHLPIAVWVIPHLSRFLGPDQNWFIYFGTYFIGSLSFGIVMSVLTEFPVLRIRDHLFPSRGRPLTVATRRPNRAMELIAFSRHGLCNNPAEPPARVMPCTGDS